MYKIQLRNNKEFLCDDATTILQSAISQGINLEYSCLSMKCKSCKVKIVEGEVKEKIEIGDLALSKEEKREGFVLSCNTLPCSDIRLDVQDIGVELPQKQLIPVKINEFTFVSKDVVKVLLRMPPKTDFKFLAGQYVNIIRGGEKRSYSLANMPNVENRLEFFIRNYEGGLFSKYWFGEAKQNDLLRIEGPLGTFFYRENIHCEHIVLLATGTGIAPIQALLQQFIQCPNLVENKKVWLFWGGRTKDDLFLEITFDSDNFRYIPVLSREKNWNGEKGYVQDVALKQNIDWTNTQVYACGSPLMIDSSKKILTEKGLQEHLFFADSFVSTN